MAQLLENSYGKERVRLTKIVRSKDSGGTKGAGWHQVYEYTVEITLYGAFDAVYTKDDNSPCVPTDTMKNTVYAVAAQTDFVTPEHLAAAVADRLITRHDQIEGVVVFVAAERWQRMLVDGEPHGHSFQKALGERTARVARGTAPPIGPLADGPDAGADAIEITSGFRGMQVFKSTGSGFSGFAKDEYTILKETDDRILATTVRAEWGYTPGRHADDPSSEYDSIFTTCENAVLRTFAGHESPSLQSTLYRMGETVLAEVPQIRWIRFVMPNQHHIAFDLKPLGLDNRGEIFYGTDSPFGVISGTVGR